MKIETPKYRTEDGMDIIIIIGFYDSDYYDRKEKWRVEDVKYKTARQKNYRYLSPDLQDDYKYRMLSREERIKYKNDYLIEFAGKDRVEDALLWAYDSIKPDIDNILGI